MSELPDKTAPPRVFLSYARGDDEAFVKRLHTDLGQAGFTVWFDRESLLSRGLTFHQEIKDAIRTEVDRVIYVGGPKAALSAYVREEWQFALECDHVVVTPIFRIGKEENVPGELSLLHCEDFRDDARYPDSLARLITSLRQLNPKLGALFAVPSLPANFLGRPELMRRVREALLVDLQKPQVIIGADARVGIQGMGGIGKSVLAAALARNREVRPSYPDGIVWIGCGQKLTDDDLLKRLRDLAHHLGGDETFSTLAQGQGMLRQLLAAKAVLLVLDNVWRAADAQAFDVIGPRCRMLVTTRDKGILDTLHGELVPVELFTEPEALQLLADAVHVPLTELPAEAREVVRECGCLPLALALCGGMAKDRGASFHSVLERLRRADLEKIADRESINEQHRNLWRAMQASVEMLPAAEQQRFAELSVFDTDQPVPEAAAATLWSHAGGLDDLDTEDLLINLFKRSLIQFDTKTGADGKILRRFRLHDLLYDYAMRIAGEAKLLHQKLLDAYAKKCSDGWPSGPNDGYFLQRLCSHLIAAGRIEELLDLHLDLHWLEAKNAAELTFDLLLDFAKAIEVIPIDNPQWHILKLVDEAIRRDAHFIARHSKDYPQALFQCIWNHGWWFDCPDAEQHYKIPQGGWTKPPPWDRSGSKLHMILNHWRSGWEKAHLDAPWLRSLRCPLIPLASPLKTVLGGHGGWVTSVAFSPDGTRIISGSNDGTVRLWDTVSGANRLIMRGHIVGGFLDGVSSVAFSPDGTKIASGGTDGTVRLWDALSGAQMCLLRKSEKKVRSVAFSPDGMQIAGGAIDRTVRVWSVCTGAELVLLHGGEEPRYIGSCLSSLAFAPDGKRIAGGFSDCTVRVWDANSGSELIVMRGSTGAVSSVAFSPDGKRIAGGVGGYGPTNGDGTVRLWDALTGAELIVLRGHKTEVSSVAFSPDGERIATGSEDGSLRVWDARTGSELTVLRGYAFTSVAFSPDGKLIVTGSRDKTVRIWDPTSGTDERVAREQEDYITCVAFSPEGEQIAIGGNETVHIRDTLTGADLAAFRENEDYVISVAFSPDGERIAIGTIVWSTFDDDEWLKVRVLDSNSGKELNEFWPGINARKLAFSVDGKSILVGSHSDDHAVLVWDASTGKPIKEYTDFNTIAPKQFPLQAVKSGLDVAVRRAVSESPVAYFPLDVDNIVCHPSGHIWAVLSNGCFFLIKLEGSELVM